MSGHDNGHFLKQSMYLSLVCEAREEMHSQIIQKQIEKQLALSFFNEISSEDEEPFNGVLISADEDESDPPSVDFSQGSTEAINSSHQQLQAREVQNQPPKRVHEMFQALKKNIKQNQVKNTCHFPSGSTAQQPHNQHKRHKRELEKRAKDSQSSKEFIRMLSNHIQSILRSKERLKLEDLVQKVRLCIPEKLRNRVSINSVTEALQKAQNPLGHFTISGKSKAKVCEQTGYIKRELDVGKYCRNLLGLLDASKVVYFISVEKLVQTRNSEPASHSGGKDQFTREESQSSPRNTMFFRGVLGSNLQSFCDILQTSDDSLARNNSFTFLLKVLSLKSGPAQRYLFMTLPFMDQYGQSLHFASEMGFIFAELASSLKAFNPLCYWLRDLKLLARKYSVRTPEELKQILQYEATRFDREVYAQYFRIVRRKLRKAISTASQPTRQGY